MVVLPVNLGYPDFLQDCASCETDHIINTIPPVNYERVIFKHALLVFKALYGLLPPYLADDCQLLADTGRRRLR